MKQDNTKVVTREYLKKELLRLEAKLDLKIDDTAENVKREIIDKLVDISGKLDDMRTENEVGSYQISDIRKDIRNHEERITKLEDSSKPA